MRIYLAGPCSRTHRATMEEAAKILRGRGFDVFCPWEMKVPHAWQMPQEDWANRVFGVDVHMIDIADYVVVISTGRRSSAGTNWEQGYAYGIGKPTVVFQVNDQETSLMTYCGCDNFISLVSPNACVSLVNYPFDGKMYRKDFCATTLT